MSSGRGTSDLTLGEIGALNGVQSLLAEAARRTGDHTVGGRHVAVVLLDGAVEACLSVCLGRHGEAASDRDTLADLYKRLERHTSQRRLSGWREASRLRRIRNLTHHHQVPVDSETLADLLPTVSAFVDNAVRATFGVRLGDVTIASAIRSEELRGQVQAAEGSLAAGELADAVAHAGAAFKSALGAWSRHRQSLTQTFVHHDELGLGRAIDGFVAPTRELVEMLAFAPDQAEAIWFDRLLRLRQRDVVGREDVRRAIRFAVDWIVRWEAYETLHRSYSEGERQVRYIDVEPSSSPDGRPEFVGAPAVVAHLDGVLVSTRMRWGTGDMDESRKQTWHHALAECCNTQGARAHLRDDVLELYVARPKDGQLDPETVVAALREIETAVASAPAKVAQADADRAAWELAAVDARSQRDDLLAGVQSATGGDSSPFTSVQELHLSTNPDGRAVRELRFHVAMPGSLIDMKDRPLLALGSLAFSGAELVWIVGDPPDAQIVVSGAVAVLGMLEQRDAEQRASQERRDGEIQAIARAVGEHFSAQP